MENSFIVSLYILLTFVFYCIAPPVRNGINVDTNAERSARDLAYFRYLTEIVDHLQADPKFKKVLEEATEDEIQSGKIIEHLDSVDHSVRDKLDQIKRIEVDYQHDLVRQKIISMDDKKRNDWNPVHHENKETFERDDLQKLINKHHALMQETDKIRRKDFKQYLMVKEHERRLKMENMTTAEKEEYIKKYNETHTKPHEKMHAPGHKAQLLETWEKEDHLDPDDFDEKTLFNLHDKNGDGFLDEYELDTFFLTELDKVYNESDPETDLKERDEDMHRMREDMMNSTDYNDDGMISLEEFLRETKDPDYEKDEEWQPIDEEEEFTEDELRDYEREHPDEVHHEGGSNGELPTPPPPEAHGEQHAETDGEKKH